MVWNHNLLLIKCFVLLLKMMGFGGIFRVTYIRVRVTTSVMVSEKHWNCFFFFYCFPISLPRQGEGEFFMCWCVFLWTLISSLVCIEIAAAFFFFRMTSHNLTWERTSWFPSSIILCWPCFFEVGPVSHKYEYLITLCSHSSGSPWDKSVFRGRLVFQLIGLEGPIENTYVSRLLSQSSSYPLMHMTSEQRQLPLTILWSSVD